MLHRMVAVVIMTVLVRDAKANVPVVEKNGALLTIELLTGLGNLEVGLENFSKGISDDRSLAWSAIGIGVGVLGVALGSREESQVGTPDVVAGAIGIGCGVLRMVGRYPERNHVSFRGGQLRVSLAF